MTELPEPAAVLIERTKTLETQRGVWTIEAKHDRPGGDVDVILDFRLYQVSSHRLFGFRRDAGVWTQLAKSWQTVHVAVREAARTLKMQALVAEEVLPLLDLAATLPDFPMQLTAAEEDEYLRSQLDDDVNENQGDEQ